MREAYRKLATQARLTLLSMCIPPAERSYAFFAAERWNMPMFRECWRARRYRKAIVPEKTRRVFVFSYGRSGTHNFMVRFHYLKCAFVIRENAFEKLHPYQFSVGVKNLRADHFVALSIFGENGLQDKRGDELTHVCFFNNRYLELETPVDLSEIDTGKDKIIYYVRNIFRILYSRSKFDQRVGKQKPRWVLTEESFAHLMRQHRRKLEEMLRLQDAYPGRIAWCFHENFCARPREEFDALCDFMDIPAASRSGWNSPMTFFKRYYGSDEQPVLKDGKLWCPDRGQFIHGTGGNYNPLPEISLERTLSDPVQELMTPSRLSIANEILGASLVDFWLKDASFPYRQSSSEDLAKRVRESLSMR